MDTAIEKEKQEILIDGSEEEEGDMAIAAQDGPRD
jgi:hypothetical protein